MDLIKRIDNYIREKELIAAEDTVIVGVSGGADSVCLLMILNALKDEYPFELKAVHVEHGIRGDASVKDMEYVQNLCRSLGVELSVHRVNAPTYANENKLSEEEAARILRYEIFEAERNSLHKENVIIAVAHHKNDAAETVIFNMLRGSSLMGLSGIRPSRDNIIRPLLGISREEIEEFHRVEGSSYCIDMTNSDNDYSRNRIRNIIIPEMEKISSASVDHIVRASEDVYEAECYIEAVACDFAKKNVIEDEGYKINVEALLKEEGIIQRAVIKLVLREAYSRWKDIGRGHIYDILSLADKEIGKVISLPGGWVAIRRKDSIDIERCEDTVCEEQLFSAIKVDKDKLYEGVDYNLGNGRRLRLSIIKREYLTKIEALNYTKCFDYDKIIGGLLIRTRKEGDYLCVDKNMHKKKLKEYFINEKIPAGDRDKVVLLTEGNHVLWVVGHRIDEYYKVGINTEKVLIAEFTEE